MNNRSVIETIMGAVVLVVAFSFVYIAYKSGNNIVASSGYTINARFEQIDGIKIGSDVKVAGITVGSVTEQMLNVKSGLYQAEIAMIIKEEVPLPEDTAATIVSESLLGGKYISLIPGGSDEMIKPGGIIDNTQSSINFESLLGRFIFNDKGEEPSDDEDIF